MIAGIQTARFIYRSTKEATDALAIDLSRGLPKTTRRSGKALTNQVPATEEEKSPVGCPYTWHSSR